MVVRSACRPAHRRRCVLPRMHAFSTATSDPNLIAAQRRRSVRSTTPSHRRPPHPEELLDSALHDPDERPPPPSSADTSVPSCGLGDLFGFEFATEEEVAREAAADWLASASGFESDVGGHGLGAVVCAFSGRRDLASSAGGVGPEGAGSDAGCGMGARSCAYSWPNAG